MIKMTKEDLKKMIEEIVEESLKEKEEIKEEIPETQVCPKCGKELKPGEKPCENCKEESLNEDIEDSEDYDEEDIEDDYEEDEEDIEDFGDYADNELPYEARYKEYWIDPDDAGKLPINKGECDLMWVSQDDIDEDDFATLLDCIGEYYKDKVNGKTYTVVMKCRSYPGYGHYFKRVVKYNNGEWETVEGEDEVLYEGKLDLLIKKLSEEEYQFELACTDEAIFGYGKTVEEAKESFLDELEYLRQYADVPDGYEITDETVEVNKPDNYTVEQALEEAMKDTGFTADEITDINDPYPVGEGEYKSYMNLK